MKESFWGLFVVILGVVGLSVLNAFYNITTTNESVYYVLKESTEAAMYDSIDMGYYRMTGNLKITKEEFVENLTRRFAESYTKTSSYKIEVYDIIEEPPKVSILITVGNKVQVYNYDANDFDIINRIDAILETQY